MQDTVQWLFKINLVVLPKRGRINAAGDRGTGFRIKVMSAQYVITDTPKDTSVLWREHEGCYLRMMGITALSRTWLNPFSFYTPFIYPTGTQILSKET